MAEIFLDVRESHWRSAFLVMVQCLAEDRKVHSAHHHLFSFLLTPARGYQLLGGKKRSFGFPSLDLHCV